MSELERFQRWAGLARLEQPPKPDVAPAVLERLRETVVFPEAATAGMWLFAAASACAAAVCAVFGYDSWLTLLGDWYGWVQDFAPWRLI
ncbi:MAG: hypothetical protein HY922_13895 [Elusimicrobia bacterium]|nr:hypothetical protein [Elusimicrobiota bacterium]